MARERQSECRVLPIGAQSGMTTEGSSWAGHDISRFLVYECLAAVAHPSLLPSAANGCLHLASVSFQGITIRAISSVG